MCVCVRVCVCVGLPYMVRYLIRVHTHVQRYRKIARYFSHDLGMYTSPNAEKYHYEHFLKILTEPRYNDPLLVCVVVCDPTHLMFISESTGNLGPETRGVYYLRKI